MTFFDPKIRRLSCYFRSLKERLLIIILLFFKRYWKAFIIYALFFIFCFVVGMIWYRPFLNFFNPSLDKAVGIISSVAKAPSENQYLVSLFLVAIIFLKNVTVVLMILLLSFRLSGLFPSFVLAVNGAVIGAVCASLAASGISWQEIMLYFTPHGIIEVPAVIGACMIAVNIKGTKEKLKKGGRWIIPLLGAAAIVEVYITPLFLGRW